jgi:hypothetical protein
MAITDARNRTQFAITLNPRLETVEFSILDYERKLQTLVFRNVEVKGDYHCFTLKFEFSNYLICSVS